MTLDFGLNCSFFFGGGGVQMPFRASSKLLNKQCTSTLKLEHMNLSLHSGIVWFFGCAEERKDQFGLALDLCGSARYFFLVQRCRPLTNHSLPLIRTRILV